MAGSMGDEGRRIRILQVNTSDEGGGAQKVVWNLHRSYVKRGYTSHLAVGKKKTVDPSIFNLDNESYRNSWAKFWISISNILSPLSAKVRGIWRIRNLLAYPIGQTHRWLEIVCGHEDFDFPATWHLLEMLHTFPDIIHCHNLHGGYFDLRALPSISYQIPMLLTLHDAWLLSGHCAHSLECERWTTGCGHCPDLTILPAIRRDGTAYNWRRKKQIYAGSKLYVATPSKWLREKVERSVLAPAVVASKVIPNGVDLSIFRSGDREEARNSLGIPSHAKVLLFTANTIRSNIWKDYETLKSAIGLAADRLTGVELIFLALGENGPTERIGKAVVRFIPYQDDPKIVSRYYQSADIYVHAASADTFPNTILEALACGIPVVATAVGGIPEQVKSIDHDSKDMNYPVHDILEATGILVPQANPDAIASAIDRLINDQALRHHLGENAARDARKRFDLERQGDEYLTWYEEIILNWNEHKLGHPPILVKEFPVPQSRKLAFP